MDSGTGRADGSGGPIRPKKTTGRRAFLKGAGAAGAVGLASSILGSNVARADDTRNIIAGSGTALAESGSGTDAVQATPAPFPSRLATAGTNIVDANGYIVSPMKGINVEPWNDITKAAQFELSDYNAMYAEGARFVRLAIDWATAEPTQGTISSTWLAAVDDAVRYCVTAGLYVWFNFRGENALRFPSWLTSDMPGYQEYAVHNYVDNSEFPNAAQLVFQTLASQYGSNEAVMGIGINEPVSDVLASNAIVTTIVDEETTIFGWVRAEGYAPDWIVGYALDSSTAAPVKDAPGSGQSSQTFTSMSTAPISGGNFMLELHDQVKCFSDTSLPPAFPDGRDTTYGYARGTIVRTSDSTYPGYPPQIDISGVNITRTQCQTEQTAFLATYEIYSKRADCPLFISERNWDPTIQSGGNSPWPDYGALNYVADKSANYQAAAIYPAMQSVWAYNTSQIADHMALRPENAGAVCVNPVTGWEYYADGFYGGPLLGTPYTIVVGGETLAAATTSYQLTVTGSTTAGDAIVVAFLNGTVTSDITDSQGNVYVLGASEVFGGQHLNVFTATYGSEGEGTPTAALTEGTDWIQVAFSSQSTGAVQMIARGCTGAVATDITGVEATGTSESPSAGPSSTLAQVTEWAVLAISSAAGGGAPSAISGGFTQTAQEHASGPYLTVAEQVTDSATALTGGATLGSSVAWTAMLVTLQPPGG